MRVKQSVPGMYTRGCHETEPRPRRSKHPETVSKQRLYTHWISVGAHLPTLLTVECEQRGSEWINVRLTSVATCTTPPTHRLFYMQDVTTMKRNRIYWIVRKPMPHFAPHLRLCWVVGLRVEHSCSETKIVATTSKHADFSTAVGRNEKSILPTRVVSFSLDNSWKIAKACTRATSAITVPGLEW